MWSIPLWVSVTLHYLCNITLYCKLLTHLFNDKPTQIILLYISYSLDTLDHTILLHRHTLLNIKYKDHKLMENNYTIRDIAFQQS